MRHLYNTLFLLSHLQELHVIYQTKLNFSMTFKDRQLNSMIFQECKMKFLISKTFQVFYDLYKPCIMIVQTKCNLNNAEFIFLKLFWAKKFKKESKYHTKNKGTWKLAKQHLACISMLDMRRMTHSWIQIKTNCVCKRPTELQHQPMFNLWNFCNCPVRIFFLAPFLFLYPFTIGTFCISCSFWLAYKVGC